jgi:hypothetical protein
VALGVDAVRQLAKAHVELPADCLPVAAGRAELRRLRALVAIRARDAERGDARVAEGEDDVARRDLAHGLAEGTAGFVSVALGRLEIAAGDFVAVGLVLVDPPLVAQKKWTKDIKFGHSCAFHPRGGSLHSHQAKCEYRSHRGPSPEEIG